MSVALPTKLDKSDTNVRTSARRDSKEETIFTNTFAIDLKRSSAIIHVKVFRTVGSLVKA